MSCQYVPYGGFRKAPIKFTSKSIQKGKEIGQEDDTQWFCHCNARNYCTEIEFKKFAFPSYPYMAVRDNPFREITRICWKCKRQWINRTIEETKKELE